MVGQKIFINQLYGFYSQAFARGWVQVISKYKPWEMFLSRYDATFILTQLFSSLLEHAKVFKDISTVVGLI